MRLDLQSLRIFLAVAEEGSLSAAALREHIAVSAVSKRLQELERTLGARLVTRTSRGVLLTAAGRRLEERARDLFQLVGRIRGEVQAFGEGTSGTVVAQANGSAIVEYLADDLRSFLDSRRRVKVELHESLSAEVVKAVAQGAADIGIFALGEAPPADLDIRPYRSDRLVALVPLSHPLAGRPSIAFHELLEFELIGVPEGSSLGQLLESVAANLARPLRFTYRVSTNEVVRRLVEAGLGVTILPEGFVRPYEGSLRIRGIPLDDPWAHRQLALCLRRGEAPTGATRELVRWLTERGTQNRDAQKEMLIPPSTTRLCPLT